MPRIQFALPERFVFSTELQIYIRGTCKIQNRNMAETLRCSIFEHFAVVRKNAQRYRIDSPVGDPQCSL
ncbi:MAG: hypothetical protein L6Q63_08140, partial [Giesbergeria sp.]|nr:hypothetical protein [Giesbergeria sp.]